MTARRVVFFGPPGVGKGTQAVQAAKALGVPQISTGDIFREARQQDSPLGREVKGFMDRGDLVPDGLVIRVVEERLGRPDCAEGFVLDGFPRTFAQAEALDRYLAKGKRPIERVVALDAPEPVILTRLGGRRTCPKCKATFHVTERPPKKADACDACGTALVVRPDDKPEAIKQRLVVYRSEVRDLVARYTKAGVLRDVVGTGAVEEVARRVADALG